MYLRHYYHLYADGNYRPIVRDHFAALRAGGLLKRIDHLHVGFVGTATNVAEAQALLKQLSRRPFSMNVAAEGWEQETQEVLYRDAATSTEPFLVLYAHTKGVAVPSELNDLWRQIMTRVTVLHWRDAVDTLKGNVGAAGCFWAPFDNGRLLNLPHDTQYFAGNFWWAHSEAIRKIGAPLRNTRFDAEAWIGGVTKLFDPYDVWNLFSAPLDVESLRRHAA